MNRHTVIFYYEAIDLLITVNNENAISTEPCTITLIQIISEINHWHQTFLDHRVQL